MRSRAFMFYSKRPFFLSVKRPLPIPVHRVQYARMVEFVPPPTTPPDDEDGYGNYCFKASTRMLLTEERPILEFRAYTENDFSKDTETLEACLRMRQGYNEVATFCGDPTLTMVRGEQIPPHGCDGRIRLYDNDGNFVKPW